MQPTKPTTALTLFRREIGECKDCDLYKTRTNLVFGVGNENAQIMFVGEAPGYYEDQKGEPFVGAAGKLLDELLRSINLTRSDIYIANVLKCRPPNNRDPIASEIMSCKDKLFRQIEIINPKIIVTLGNFSTKLLLNLESGISKLRGKPYQTGDRVFFPIYHPAAGLYTSSVKDVLFADFKKLELLVNKSEDREHRELVVAETVAYGNKTNIESPDDGGQLTLW